MAKIRIQQTRSRIGAPKDQKRTLDALGLTKMNRVVEHEDIYNVLIEFKSGCRIYQYNQKNRSWYRFR